MATPRRSTTPAKKAPAKRAPTPAGMGSPPKQNPAAAAAAPTHCAVTGAACDPATAGAEPVRATIAVSDAFNVFGHAFAAAIALRAGNRLAALGFASVALAAAFGVLRYGVCPPGFRAANKAYANLAGFVGMPLVGYNSWKALGGVAAFCNALQCCTAAKAGGDEIDYIVVVLVLFGAVSAGVKTPAGMDLARVAVNVVFFVAPVVFAAIAGANWALVASVAGYVFAAAVITPDEERCLFGVRRVNWFHYAIGAGAVGIAKGLAA